METPEYHYPCKVTPDDFYLHLRNLARQVLCSDVYMRSARPTPASHDPPISIRTLVEHCTDPLLKFLTMCYVYIDQSSGNVSITFNGYQTWHPTHKGHATIHFTTRLDLTIQPTARAGGYLGYRHDLTPGYLKIPPTHAIFRVRQAALYMRLQLKTAEAAHRRVRARMTDD